MFLMVILCVGDRSVAANSDITILSILAAM